MSTNLYDPDAELERLYVAITGRPAFSYDPASDPVTIPTPIATSAAAASPCATRWVRPPP